MKWVRHKSGRATWWIAVVLTLMLAITDRATARQYEILTKAEQTAKRSFFSGRDVKAMTEILRLSEGQRIAAQELVQAYQTSCRDLSEKCDDLWSRLDEEGEHSHWNDGEDEAYEELRHVFVVTSLDLHRSVLTDLRSLLTKEQEPLWERFDRAHRRHSTLAWGSASPAGSGDLIEIVTSFDPASLAVQGIADLLNAYEVELERELVARNSRVEKIMLTKDESVAVLGEPAPESIDKLFEELAEASKKIGALNRRVAASLTPQFSDDKQARFKDVVNLEFFPTVYGKRHVHRVLEATKTMKDVDVAQQEGIKGIRERYEREAETLNARWVQVLIQAEAEKDEEAIDAADGQEEQCRSARRELDARTVEDLKKILTEDQRKALPSIGFRREIQLLKPQTVK